MAATKKKINTDYVSTIGRRKEAVARVRLYAKVKDNVMFAGHKVTKGDILVNGKAASEYFSGVVAKARFGTPLRITNNLNKFAITIKVTGGGQSGQLDAAVHGIARALSKIDKEKAYPILKKAGFLTRDARARQRRKVGMGGKSRRKKQSPKR